MSSSKPGCSIPQLRHPSPSLFWQSDGPQPHYLNIHFFKLVRIVGLRLYLDFEQDESYTPTRIIFLAGSGMNDLQEWGEMRSESPRGWVWADFSGVGDASDDDDSAEEDDSEDDDAFQARMLSGLNRPRNRRTSEHRSSDSENMPLPPQRQRVPSNFPTHLDTPQQPFDTPVNAPQLPQHRTPQFTPQFTPQTQRETPTLQRQCPVCHSAVSVRMQHPSLSAPRAARRCLSCGRIWCRSRSWRTTRTGRIRICAVYRSLRAMTRVGGVR